MKASLSICIAAAVLAPSLAIAQPAPPPPPPEARPPIVVMPPPAAPYGYGYPPPQEAYRPIGPKTLPYHEGEPAPTGYELEDRANKGVIIAGGATFGAFWLGSIAASFIILLDDSVHSICIGCTSSYPEHKDAGLLMIPLAGPWISMGTLHPSELGTVGLGALGVGQAAGLAILIAGIATPKPTWVRQVDRASVKPWVGPGFLGVQGAM